MNNERRKVVVLSRFKRQTGFLWRITRRFAGSRWLASLFPGIFHFLLFRILALVQKFRKEKIYADDLAIGDTVNHHTDLYTVKGILEETDSKGDVIYKVTIEHQSNPSIVLRGINASELQRLSPEKPYEANNDEFDSE